jgi:hypothetical protein
MAVIFQIKSGLEFSYVYRIGLGMSESVSDFGLGLGVGDSVSDQIDNSVLESD